MANAGKKFREVEPLAAFDPPAPHVTDPERFHYQEGPAAVFAVVLDFRFRQNISESCFIVCAPGANDEVCEVAAWGIVRVAVHLPRNPWSHDEKPYRKGRFSVAGETIGRPSR